MQLKIETSKLYKFGANVFCRITTIHTTTNAAMGKGTKILANLLVIVIAASFTTSTCIAVETEPQPVEAAKDSPATLEFLRVCCNTTNTVHTEYAKDCYDALLPQAESFQGNHIKISIAATNILATHLQSYLNELRHLNSTTTEYTLDDCIKFADASNNLCKEWLPKLERLDAIGKGKLDERSLGYVKTMLHKVESGFGKCSMDIGDIMNKGEVLPSESSVYPFIRISQALVNGIPSTGATAPTSA
jgi:hypothetical protein